MAEKTILQSQLEDEEVRDERASGGVVSSAAPELIYGTGEAPASLVEPVCGVKASMHPSHRSLTMMRTV